MPSCMICGRSVNKHSKLPNITFHKFPSKECIRIKWNNFLLENALSPEKVTKNSLVCSLHFNQSCFVLDKSRKLLQSHSYPSIIVKRIKSAKQCYPETLMTCPVPYEVPNSSSNILNCNQTLVKLSYSTKGIEGVLPLDDTIPAAESSLISESSSETSKTFNKVSLSCNTNSMECVSTLDEFEESSFLVASKVTQDDIPRWLFLKRGIQALLAEVAIKNNKMKSLCQTVRRQKKKIASMKLIIEELKNKNKH